MNRRSGGAPARTSAVSARLLLSACLLPAALGLPLDRRAFVPAYLLGLDGWSAPIDAVSGLLGLFSYVFVHDGVGHLAANAAALTLFGPIVARRLGGCGFLLLFFTAAAVAALVEGAMAADRLAPLAGASGGVSALMAAILVASPRAAFHPPFIGARFRLPLAVPVLLDLTGNLATGILSASEAAPLLESVAWRAHLAGMAAGAVAGWALRRRFEDAAPFRWPSSGFARGDWKGNVLTAVCWAAAAVGAARGW